MEFLEMLSIMMIYPLYSIYFIIGITLLLVYTMINFGVISIVNKLTESTCLVFPFSVFVPIPPKPFHAFHFIYFAFYFIMIISFYYILKNSYVLVNRNKEIDMINWMHEYYDEHKYKINENTIESVSKWKYHTNFKGLSTENKKSLFIEIKKTSKIKIRDFGLKEWSTLVAVVCCYTCYWILFIYLSLNLYG